MPKPAFKLELKENGQPKTAGLSSAQFITAFNQIQKRNNERRRNAGRAIPRNFAKLTNKQVAELGKRNGGLGSPFSRDDLLNLHAESQRHKKKYGGSTAGISVLEIMANSRTIDIKRANNQVTDGTGIKAGHIARIRGNMLNWVVDASEKHGADNHQVKVRLEELDEALNDTHEDRSQYVKTAKAIIKGRVSFDCSCDRHQFYYRYMATIGNYCVAPPKEFSPPAQTNASMQGVACKHVLFVLNKMRSPSFANRLASDLQRQATAKGFGDDRKLAKTFDDKEVKAQRKGRKGKINQSKLNTEYLRYKRRLSAFAKKKQDEAKQNKQNRKELGKARRAATVANKKVSKLSQEKRDLVKMVYQLRKDQLAVAGSSQKDINKTIAKETNVSIKELESIING